MPWFGSPGKEQGDQAPIEFEDNTQLHCRKIDGIWKLDITPAKPQTPADMTKILEHDSQTLDQITANVSAGKYEEIDRMRDALMSAKLSGNPQTGSSSPGSP
jgi:hypothetical protein